MEQEHKRTARNLPPKDEKKKNALDNLIAAKKSGVKRVEQYEQEKHEAKNDFIENENSNSSLDSFIEHDPTVDKYYREVEEYEEEDDQIDERPQLKKVKQTNAPSASNQTMALLRFQSIPNQAKKAEPKKDKKPVAQIEKVNLDDLWEKADDTALLAQNDPSYLMLSEHEKQLMNYDMVIIKPKAQPQNVNPVASSSAHKRKKDIVEEMNQRQSGSPIIPSVKETPKLGTIHQEFNDDSNTFKELLESDLAFEVKTQRLDKSTPKPSSYLPEDEKTDSQLMEELFSKAKKEDDLALKNSWQDAQQTQEIIPEEASVINKNDQLPLEDDNLYFYYIDAWEDQREHPGFVYLFGKVRNPKIPNQFESCCIAVRNVSRVAYVVPSEYKREENTIAPDDIKVDFLAIMNEFKGKLHNNHQQKLKIKVVDRIYSFELPILHGKRKYLKVKYDGHLPPIPENLSGKTFSHVLGTSWSLLENFVIKKEIKGPQWLKIAKPEKVNLSNKKSWCVFECNSSFENISKCEGENRPNPPLRVMTIALKTVRIGGNFEIANISAIKFNKIDTDKNIDIHHKDNGMSFFSIVRKLQGQQLPKDFETKASKQRYKIKVEESEPALINNFISQICDFDPDIISSHDAYTQSIEVLLARIKKLRISNWGKISRLRKTGNHPEGSSLYRVRYSTCGRLICDTFLSAREFVRETDYNLTHLAKSLLGERREDFDQNSSHLFYRDTDLLLKMIDHTTQDAFLTSCIMFKLQIIPLTKHLTCIAGNSWARSLQNARAERNEMLLIHEFHSKKFIYPDKRSFKNEERALFENDEIQEKNNKKKDKKKYAGGLVLEPKMGLYNDIILLLDFNSLYPSIIQEYNICFTTIERPPTTFDKKAQQADAMDEEIVVPEDIDFSKLKRIDNDDSILPKVIKSLVQQRRDVKKLLKTERNEAKIQSLDIKQKAIKLVANSMYGCLGFSSSRFYAKPLAATITRYGRQILEESVMKVQDKIGKEVIYGDTDSIMINTQSTQIPEAITLGNRIKKEINEKYKCLEIEIDGIFLPLLLVKKKKYAAMKLENLGDYMAGNMDAIPRFRQEVKGLDMVRRDWCLLSKKASSLVLKEVLSRKGMDEMFEAVKLEMSKLNKRVRGEEGPACTLKDFTITKQLTKDPAKYPDIKGQPHVVIAKRLLEKGIQANALINHYIPYVIIKNDRENLGDKACHPDEFAQQKTNYELDIEWYITQQVMPPIQRLLQVIPGVLVSEVANCYGIDGTRYRNVMRSYKNDEEEAQEQVESYYNSIMNPTSLKDEFKLEFKLKCTACGEDFIFSPQPRNEIQYCPYICTKCKVGDVNLKQLMNLIKLKVRDQIESYYLHHMKDSEGKPVKTLLLAGQKVEEKKSKDVLIYLRGIKAFFQKKNDSWKPEYISFGDKVVKYIDELLKKSKFETINLDQIFSKFKELNIP